MKRVFLAGAAMTAIMAGSAFAADMTVYRWNGCYVGAHGGAAWGLDHMTWNEVHAEIGVPVNPITFPSTTPAGIAGGQVGCNWQFSYALWPVSSFVVGLEGDASGVSIGNSGYSSPMTSPGITLPGGSVYMSEKISSLESVRGRAGFLWNNVFFYGTAGAAWANQSFYGHAIYPVNEFSSTTSLSRTASGWVAGGGAEAMVWSNWLVRLEYLDYGGFDSTSTVHLTPSISHDPHPFNIYSYGTSSIQVLRLGLSYKFY
jgi:outer membrane immunogenic protein